MSYQDDLSDNLLYVQKARKEMDSFGNIGGGPLLNKAKSILAQLEELEEKIIIAIRKEDHKN